MTVARMVYRAVAVVPAATVLVLSAGCGGGLRDGPLVIGDSKGAVVGAQARKGQHVAYGFNVVTNSGDVPITNVTVALIPDSDHGEQGVSFEPPQVVDIAETELGALAAGPWPDEDVTEHARPLEGYAFAPKSGKIQLLFIMTVEGGDHRQWFWPKTRVEYDYDGHRYAEEVDNAFSLCAPAPCQTRRS